MGEMSKGDEPVYPSVKIITGDKEYQEFGGLSKREYFAGFLFQVFCTIPTPPNEGGWDEKFKLAASLSIRAAAALLAELAKEPHDQP